MKHYSTKEERVSLKLSLYQSGMALIEEIRRNTGYQGKENLIIQDIPQTLDLSSVMLDPQPRTLSYHEGQFDRNRYLRSLLDQDVTATGIGTVYRGKLLAFDETGLLLDEKGAQRFIAHPQSLHGKENYPYSRICLDGQFNQLENTLSLSYLSHGFSWSMHYRLVFENDKTQLDAVLEVDNHSGLDFEDAKCVFVSGESRAYHAKQASSMVLRSNLELADEQVSESLYSFGLDDEITLEQGQRLILPYLKSVSGYTQEIRSHYRSNQASEWFKFMADTRKSFLPGGSLKIYEKLGDGLTFKSEGHLKLQSAQDEVEVYGGESLHVKVSTVLKEANDETELYTFSLENRGDTDKKVVYTVSDSWIQSLSGATHPFEQLSANEYQLLAVLGANTKLEGSYTLKRRK